jgi:hypothetical protein
LILLVIGVAISLPALAPAQPGISNEVEKELVRTDMILDRAREQMGMSITSRANDLLRQAQELQQRAWRKFHTEDSRHHRQVLELTLKARELAQRAIETAELEAQAYEKTRDLVESTKDLIDRANTEIRESGDPQAIRLLEGGIWQLQKAREAYRSREYRKAIQLAATAHDLVERALQRSRDVSTSDRSMTEAALDQTESLIGEVRDRLRASPDPKAQKLFEQARDLHSRARDHYRNDRDDMAIRLATRARQLALDALLILTRDPDRRDVEQALTIVEQLIEDLVPEIRRSDSERAKRLLRSARERHREAVEELDRGKLAKALETARLADGLLRRAAEAAGLR